VGIQLIIAPSGRRSMYHRRDKATFPSRISYRWPRNRSRPSRCPGPKSSRNGDGCSFAGDRAHPPHPCAYVSEKEIVKIVRLCEGEPGEPQFLEEITKSTWRRAALTASSTSMTRSTTTRCAWCSSTGQASASYLQRPPQTRLLPRCATGRDQWKRTDRGTRRRIEAARDSVRADDYRRRAGRVSKRGVHGEAEHAEKPLSTFPPHPPPLCVLGAKPFPLEWRDGHQRTRRRGGPRRMRSPGCGAGDAAGGWISRAQPG